MSLAGERMTVLHMTRETFDAVRAHCEQTYPDEGCGALLGRPTQDGWLIHSVVRATNACAESAHNRYEISGLELVKIERMARELEMSVAGFYHSHPDHAAQWSETDLAEAHWLGCFYVITAVMQGKATVTNSFLLMGEAEEDKRFEFGSIEIRD
jgi:proteasome lid subunit RPN8/RPN11